MDNEKDIEIQDQEQGQDLVGKEDTEETKETEENKNDPMYRGKVLMQSALDHLERGEIDEFEADRQLANEYFDKRALEDEEMDSLYNESRNFGIIFNVIEANTSKLMESVRGQKSLRRIVNCIKGDKVLHEEFKAYNNLQPQYRVVNANEYINEALSMSPSFDTKSVKKSNEKLIRLMKDEKLNEMIDIEDDKLNLYEAIEYVTMNKKSLTNIDEFITARNVIAESIDKLPIKKGFTIEEYANEVESLSENFAGELNSAEMMIIKEVTEENGENYFNKCKAETLSRLSEMVAKERDIDVKSRLSKIYETVNKKTYSKKRVIVDISEMIEIQNTIDE